MSLGENIFNAFEVVNKTHENVNKLIEFCRTMALEKKEFDLVSPKFLRHKSDVDYWGWNTTQMFLLFQDMQNELLENGWRNGPIYVLEICLYSLYVSEPILEMAKFEYEDIKNFSPRVSPTEYFYFRDPLYDLAYDELENGILVTEIPEEMSQKYKGLKRVSCKEVLLVDVNSENAYQTIFGTFKELQDI